LGYESEAYLRRVEQIRVHGSQDLFVAGDYCDFREQDVLDTFKNPAPMMKMLEASAAHAVRQGARVLIPHFPRLPGERARFDST